MLSWENLTVHHLPQWVLQFSGLLSIHVAQRLNRNACLLQVIKYISLYPSSYTLAGRSTRQYMRRFGSFMNQLTCGLGHGIANIFTRNQQHSYIDIQTHHSDCDDSTNQSSVPLWRQHGVPFVSSELPFNSTDDEDMADFFRDDIHAEDVGHFPFVRSHSPVSTFSGYSGLRSSSSGYSGLRSSSSGYSGSRSSSSGYTELRSSSSGYSGSHSSSSGYTGLHSFSSGYSELHSSSSGYSESTYHPSSPNLAPDFKSHMPGFQQTPCGSLDDLPQNGNKMFHHHPPLSISHQIRTHYRKSKRSSVYSHQTDYHTPSSNPFPSIPDDVIQTVLSCLLHSSNCQIPNCPCKLVQLRYRELLQKQPNQISNTLDTRATNIYPRECKHQLHFTLSSQNLNSETHPHYHLTSKSHIRQVTKPPLQRKRSNLTPVCEAVPEFSQAATAGLPDEKQFYHDPTYEEFKPPLLLKETSISAENIPSLCLNDCPLTPTPVREGQTLEFSTIHLRSRRWSMPKTDLKTVKENSQSTDSLETIESNTSSQSSSLEKTGSLLDGKLLSRIPRPKHSGGFVPCQHPRRRSISPVPSLPSGYRRGESASPVPPYPSAHSTSPILLNPSEYKHGQSVWQYPSYPIGYKTGEAVPYQGRYKRKQSTSGYKRKKSVSPVPLSPSGFRRGESGYESTTEIIQNTPWTHRWEQSNSGYANNPMLVNLSTKAGELRRTERDIKPRKTVMETLV